MKKVGGRWMFSVWDYKVIAAWLGQTYRHFIDEDFRRAIAYRGRRARRR